MLRWSCCVVCLVYDAPCSLYIAQSSLCKWFAGIMACGWQVAGSCAAARPTTQSSPPSSMQRTNVGASITSRCIHKPSRPLPSHNPTHHSPSHFQPPLTPPPCIPSYHSNSTQTQVVKIGEGTYGEAFKSGQVVFKFVPMEGCNLINGWPQKGAGDLLGEAIIALALTDLRQDRDDAGEAAARQPTPVGMV